MIIILILILKKIRFKFLSNYEFLIRLIYCIEINIIQYI